MTARRAIALLLMVLVMSQPVTPADAEPFPAAVTPPRAIVGDFVIDRTEVTVAQFERFVRATGLVTAAERAGGGFEYDGGWVKRPGWTFRAPSGAPAAPNDPVAHVTWAEARDYCAFMSGRLPTFAQWQLAAYTETRSNPAGDFVTGRTYPYPVGDAPDGMNISGNGRWTRHAPAGVSKEGVNGLYDMGGNVWEWLADRDGERAFTAGGSWWYGAAQTRVDGAQWKPVAFAAVYIGFRCVYDITR